METKTVRVPPSSTRGFVTRSIFTPSMDSVITKHVLDGWTLKSSTPINNMRGKTTEFLLVFERDDGSK